MLLIRKLILTLHLWAGFAAAVFLFLLGVSRSLMAFEEEMNRLAFNQFTGTF